MMCMFAISKAVFGVVSRETEDADFSRAPNRTCIFVKTVFIQRSAGESIDISYAISLYV